MRVLKLFIASFLPGIVKPLHTLWNELLAITFALLATAVTFGPVRKGYRDLDGDPANAIFLDALMIWFGIQSFRRARKIARS